MKKSFTVVQPHSWSGSDLDETEQVHSQSIVVPVNVIATADSFEKKDHSWFVTSQIPTDLSVRVQDITFYVHKYPLASRCGYLEHIELQPSDSNLGYDLRLENFPGGSEIFGTVLKFCYGLPIDLKPDNVAALRCASEFLEMTEELEEGNLISKTEAFLTFVVLSSWKDSITVLKSCETLSPLAENLQIVRRCCDSIAWKASRETPTSGEGMNEEIWWLNDVATLRIDHFTRIITVIRIKGLRPETVGSCITKYAQNWLPGMDIEMEGKQRYGSRNNELLWSISSGRRQEGGIGHSKEQRMIIESLVSMLPPQREAVSCKFLLQILRMAIVYSASPALVSELEKRVGMVLENADVNDLLIPNYTTGDQGKPVNSSEDKTIHNIDSVQRILEYFLIHEQQQQPRKHGKSKISKLLDNYLAEIARDPNLTVTSFQVIAETLPDNARTCDDGLYRAIDIYLKNHSMLSEHDRRRLCKTIACEKLSIDACTHAAQNERLPLRTIIQVLFSEQLKMRAAMEGKEQVANGDNSDQEDGWSSTKTEIKKLKTELEQVKTKMAELQHDYSELQQDYGTLNNKRGSLSGWTAGWRKIKNSGLFHAKHDTDENRERQLRPNSIGCRVYFRHRKSVS